MESLELNTDRVLHRRAAKKGGSFKENKVVITESRSRATRTKKSDPHVAIESPEFQLLVRLYVPANLLIKNNKVSLKQLTKYLPVILNDNFPELNFELHIFLSTIVTSYVSSWYLQKLNTDNLEFIHLVYTTLCAFVKDLSRRISVVFESEDLLNLINELASIIDNHLKDNELIDGIAQYNWDILKRHANNVAEQRTVSDLRQTYLRESHASFNDAWAAERRFDSSDVSGTDEDPSATPLVTYLRVLVKNVLDSTFSGSEIAEQGPASSAITTNLVTLILADLVLGKVVAKLSSPRFLLGGLAKNAIDKLGKQLGQRLKRTNNTSNPSLSQRLKRSAQSVYFNFSSISLALHQHIWDHTPRPTVFFSPVISLFNTVTGVATRKAIICKAIETARSVLFISEKAGAKLDSFVGTIILHNIRCSSVLNDSSVAQAVASLRHALFDKTPESTNTSGESLSIKDLTDLAFEVLQNKAGQSLPFGLSLMWFSYSGEDERAMKSRISQFFSIFDRTYPEVTSPLNESSDINLLLVMKLMDCVIQHVYPELTTALI